jgi:hypothetical protein
MLRVWATMTLTLGSKTSGDNMLTFLLESAVQLVTVQLEQRFALGLMHGSITLLYVCCMWLARCCSDSNMCC